MSNRESHSWPPDIAGVILAGGRARRMGRDKAAVEYRGKRLIDIARNVLHEAGCSEIIISGPSTYGLPVRQIPDDLHDAGPLAGLSAVLSALAVGNRQFEAIVTIPVDCPNLKPETLAALAREPGAAISVTRSGSHPTVGRWPIRIREQLDQYLATGGRTFAEFAMLVGANLVQVDDANQFLNINSPADLPG